MAKRDATDVEHPSCPTCGAPMWLVKIQDYPSDTKSDTLFFECKACGATSVDAASPE